MDMQSTERTEVETEMTILCQPCPGAHVCYFWRHDFESYITALLGFSLKTLKF